MTYSETRQAFRIKQLKEYTESSYRLTSKVLKPIL